MSSTYLPCPYTYALAENFSIDAIISPLQGYWKSLLEIQRYIVVNDLSKTIRQFLDL